MTAEIIYLHQKQNNDPELSAYEEIKSLKMMLSSLPEGDEADAIICRISECELRIISQQAQSHSGLVAHLELLRSWGDKGVAPSRSLIVAGGTLLAIFIRDWARRLAGRVGGIAIIAQARHARAIQRVRSRFPRGPRHRNLKSKPRLEGRVCISGEKRAAVL